VNFERYHAVLEATNSLAPHGVVDKVTGLVIETSGGMGSIGELCRIRQGADDMPAEIVGFRKGSMLLMPLGGVHALRPDAEVRPTGHPLRVAVSEALAGRVLNGLGEPMDGRPAPKTEEYYPVHAVPPHPLTRSRIKNAMPTGVRAIDSFMTIGEGQRVGLFSGSGVGKSTLVGMIARHSSADINVIAMIGERGREVREFMEKDLRASGLAKSVLVISTSDQPALLRIKAALVATSIAEYFRDKGKKVMLIMDSVTRFAFAQREVGLSVGEPPTVRGYPPSVFAYLPRLLERTGQGEKGSITGIYTVLVDGDDHNEPVADSIRGILDGHIVLSRELATKNHYPAIDVLSSLSRVMPDITTVEHCRRASLLRDQLAVCRQSEDLVRIGAYTKGSNAELDRALEQLPKINAYLKQGIGEEAKFETSLSGLKELAK
jgi:FliI/YscN family ATPase